MNQQMALARKGKVKMNGKQMEKKIERDAEKVKKDINTLLDDGVTQASRGFEKLTGDAKKFTGEAKESLANTAASVGKDIGKGLKQYNAKANEIAENVPGDLGKKVSQYPWVAISIGLGIGLLLGGFFKHAKRS
jgi:ElaB/YqjD/DUF883 family membrane-anchored ribosome-binding protein